MGVLICVKFKMREREMGQERSFENNLPQLNLMINYYLPYILRALQNCVFVK